METEGEKERLIGRESEREKGWQEGRENHLRFFTQTSQRKEATAI